MTLRFVNTTLLGLFALLTLSGLYGIVWPFPAWMYELHRMSGWALLALVPWKTIISLRSLKRGLKPNFDRGLLPFVSLILSAATVFVIVLGLMWAWRLGPTALWLRETVISWHWILALVLIPPFVLHAWARWPRPKKAEFLSRQGFIKLAGLGLVGAAGWGASKTVAFLRTIPSAPRAATGSRLDGYLSGNNFPVTTGAGDGQLPIDLDSWRLRVNGAEKKPLAFTYDEFLTLPQVSQVATLDCTIGWYSVQRWRGVSMLTILEEAVPAAEVLTVSLRAAEGYTHAIPFAEAQNILLATHVGGQPLAHAHGFPLRAVVPSRRGWFWVKWLSEIELTS